MVPVANSALCFSINRPQRRQVLDCGSPLPPLNVCRGAESGRERPQSKPLLRPAQILALLLVAAQTVFSQTTYEAESAALANGARVFNCKTCSGGKQVGFIGGENNGTVTFTVRAKAAGLYPVTVYYHVGDDRPLTITVNTNARWDLIFPRTTGDGEISSRIVSVPLNAGDNVIAFNHAEEFAPDLDRIVVPPTPAASTAIAGSVTSAAGAPLGGVEVDLSGFGFEMKAVTDARGRYGFPFLPPGNYYVRAEAPLPFAPYEHFCPATNATFHGQDFTARKPAAKNPALLRLGQWRIEYDLANGTADIFFAGKPLLRNIFAAARLPETVTSLDYRRRKITRAKIHDAFGRGETLVVESSNGTADKMRQTFRLYENADYFLADVAIMRTPAVSSRYLSPLTTHTPAAFRAGDDRTLFVPFDNDKWVRYDARPFGGEVTSYEVSALYDNTSREGLVIGSIEHNTWKTGVRSTTASNAITSLEVFGGITSSETRDVLPHGKVSGATITSPKIFVGCFSDWRDGLDAYAKANAVVAPPRVWQGGVPFGWNSWGKLQFKLTFKKAIEVSDFFAKELQPNHFENNGMVYIGLDSGWNKFSDTELKQFVQHCESNHQAAGIYFTPFTAWGAKDDDPVPGTPYRYKDIFLHAHGRKQHIASGVALDPTHPGTQALIRATLQRFQQAGFQYVKADFLNYGALEADRYYDPGVTTGIQAYNEGMQFVEKTLGKLYLNESIAPLFPAQYANSRRIGCDAFGSIANTEYTLNSLTYGWWLSKVYDFNDADEIVLDGFREGENRARVTSAAITGLFISGDDFSAGGSARGKERAKKFLTNADVDNVARIRKSFRPVEGDTGNHAANLFTFQDRNHFYLAAFNYSATNADWRVDFSRVGLQTRGPVAGKELWSGAPIAATRSLNLHLPGTDAALYRFPLPAPPQREPSR